MSPKRIVLISLISLFSALLLASLVLVISAAVAFNSVPDPGLPRLEIYTDNRLASIRKDRYSTCTVSLEGAGKYDFSELDGEIRGRGNTTWKFYPKKPYRIRFTEKTSVFGGEENRSWVLLAMYNDFSYIKDRLAFTLADSIGSEDFVPSYNYVELYINGSYKGLYLLTDQVDENKGRAEVKTDFSSTDTEVPFLAELDEYAPEEGVEGVDYFTVGKRYYSIKYPEAKERYSEAQFLYVKEYIEKVDSLTRKKNVTVSELSEYIDLQSFIDYYIVEELMGQTEINYKSVYMSKAVGGKLKMGPVWDFDWAVNGPYLTEYKNVNIDRIEGLCSGDNFFGNLYHNSPEFRRALSERYLEVRDSLSKAIDAVKSEKALIENAAKRDKIRWHLFHFNADFEERSSEVINWVENRLLWLDKAFTVK